MDYIIQKFLKHNNLTGVNGIDYSLQNDGDGDYIKSWNINISKPSFIENMTSVLQQVNSCETLEELNAINIDFK